MNIDIHNDISIDFKLLPKKSRTDNRKYCIYIDFPIYQKGIKKLKHILSTGITVNVTDFKRGQIIGRGERAKLINERLDEYMSKAKNFCVELAGKKPKTCKEVLNEIKANAKQRITGKAPKAVKGIENKFVSRMKDYEIEEVLKMFLADKEQSVGRQRNYNRCVSF